METNKEENKEKEISKTDIKLLLVKAKNHIDSVKAELLKYAGKVGHNPYLWLKINNLTLAEEILKSPQSFEDATIINILTKVLNTKAEQPIMNSPIIPTTKELLKTK